MLALRASGDYWVLGPLGRADDLSGAADDVDVLVIATPDAEVAKVAAAVTPREDTVVLHLSGSLPVDVLAPHPRRGSVHPLVPLPTPAVGSRRLRSGTTFTVAGDPEGVRLVGALGGRVLTVDDGDRVAYHAAATIATNHVVALLGQVERVAATAGLPFEVFGDLVRAAVDDAVALGPGAALTGPAARGDWETVTRHRDVLGAMEGGWTEVVAYDACVSLAHRLATTTTAADRLEVPV
jgi:predicted short-subunit dehydrogenase-like oxidoreductase (DUF2520 family)